MSLIDENEIVELAARYGRPLRWSCTLDVSKNQTRVPFRDRSAEIVLAISRSNRRVLLHTNSARSDGRFVVRALAR